MPCRHAGWRSTGADRVDRAASVLRERSLFAAYVCRAGRGADRSLWPSYACRPASSGGCRRRARRPGREPSRCCSARSGEPDDTITDGDGPARSGLDRSELLGVDDVATRRGQHYGTVFIDCETGQPLDLLPGRDAATLANWLREHPGSEIICRDRAGAYAEGARTGAPNAIQVADRFHLWQNLGTAVERSVRRHNNCLKSAAVSDEGLTNDAVADHADAEKEMSPIEARIRERHATVHALLAQGHGICEIARELHMGGNTVRRTARAETPEQLLTGRRQPRPSQLDPYKAHLDKRWA